MSNFYSRPDAVMAAFYLVNQANGGNHLVDDAGNTIDIDTINGLVYKNGKLVCPVSEKRNGYKYVVARIDTVRDGMTNVWVGCHALVAMVNDYSHFMKNGHVPCHIDNCPWNNRSDNLEWGSVRDNNIHGRIVACLHKEFPGLFTFENRGHIILKKGIKNIWIKEYRALHGLNCFAVEPGLTIDARGLVDFVDFLERKHYW